MYVCCFVKEFSILPRRQKMNVEHPIHPSYKKEKGVIYEFDFNF